MLSNPKTVRVKVKPSLLSSMARVVSLRDLSVSSVDRQNYQGPLQSSEQDNDTWDENVDGDNQTLESGIQGDKDGLEGGIEDERQLEEQIDDNLWHVDQWKLLG